ncbi:MAG: hypothetical protein H5T97_05050 [Firmicutes bacterium]|nr:hypothetical protein [Bacillota bacterium]
MQEWFSLLRESRLRGFYISLPAAEKRLLAGLSRRILAAVRSCPLGFRPRTPAQFLWVAAANALPRGHHSFAEKLLLHALQVAGSERDRACAHANLAQLYFELRDRLPDAREKCRRHCEATLRSGLFTCWATKLLKALEEGEAGGACRPV